MIKNLTDKVKDYVPEKLKYIAERVREIALDDAPTVVKFACFQLVPFASLLPLLPAFLLENYKKQL